MFTSLFSFDPHPIGEWTRLQREMDRAWQRTPPAGIRSVLRGTYPPINIGATADRVDVYLFASGLDAQSLDITIQQNLLSVNGAAKEPADPDVTYYRRERERGGFRRVITLPDDVDPGKVQAKYRDGILQITVQRRETARPRQIAVE